MMSNPPSSLQSRQKLHKRQRSTPVAFEAMKVQMPPNPTQRQGLHRRGQSYDLARSPIRRHQHTGSMVGTNTNLGSIQGQQILREAQQQRIARPGQQHIQPQVETILAQQCGPLSDTSYDMTINAIMPSQQGMMQHPNFHGMQMPLSAGVQDAYMLDENSQHYFQTLHAVQDAAHMMPMDRRLSQPDMRIQTAMRPYTPNHQIQTANFPLTPAQTPMHQQNASSGPPSPVWRQVDDNIVSPRPVSMQKSRSLQGIAEHPELEFFAKSFAAPSLQAAQTNQNAGEPTKQRRAAPLKSTSANAVKQDTQTLFGEFSKDAPPLEEASHLVLSSTNPPSSPTRPALSPRRMSISDLNLDPGISASIEETNITLDDIAQYIEGPDPIDNKWTCKYEDCNKKFGRKENIKSHVQTHLGDRQFRCDHCKKCFVRGHDLKRHAKIHTGQKAYACACGNAFARHDALTRHRQRGMCIGAFEGIVRKEIKRGRPRKHRPEMDDRLDKATRTRQKKQQSPGSQIDVYASSASSCSVSSWGSPPTETMDHLSIHGGDPNSPAMTYDDTMHLFGVPSQGMDLNQHAHIDPLGQVALPPDMFSFTPPASPGYSTGNQPSPSHRALTPADLASFSTEQSSTQISGQPMNDIDLLPSNTPSQPSEQMDESTYANQVALEPNDPFDLPSIPQSQQNPSLSQQATSLPSLSHSSSPPPQESGSVLVFDFPDDPNQLRMSTMSNISNLSFGLSAVTKAMSSEAQVGSGNDDPPRNEFDSFLDYNDDSQLSLGMHMGMDNSDAFFASL